MIFILILIFKVLSELLRQKFQIITKSIENLLKFNKKNIQKNHKITGILTFLILLVLEFNVAIEY